MSLERLARLTVAALGLLLSLGAAHAEGVPGRFDYYVLALSWSPTYCETKGKDAEPAQCAARARGSAA